MTLRPCLTCGEPSPGTYCPGCRPADTRTNRKAEGHVHANRALWKALSARARKMQPWCRDCGSREDLCADHIIPFAACPELAHTIENLTVRCRSCNGRRGANYTESDAIAVLTALQQTYKRRPTKQGRERIAAAQRAAQGGERGLTGASTTPLPRRGGQ